MERFTISLDDGLARQFDAWVATRSYANRSEAVRDLLRAELGRSKLREPADQECVACLSYVFNHHQRDLAERLIAMQHDHHDLIISSMQAHLDHDHRLETVILRGRVSAVTPFADEVCAQRGVHHGRLNVIPVELHEPHVERKPKRSAAAHVHLKPTA